jgi:hypothetical protein
MALNTSKARFIQELGLSEYDADVLTSQKSLADYNLLNGACVCHLFKPFGGNNIIGTALTIPHGLEYIFGNFP